MTDDLEREVRAALAPTLRAALDAEKIHAALSGIEATR